MLARQVRALILTSDDYRHALAVRAGIGLTDATALGHLYHDGAQNLGQVAHHLNLTPGAITALADRMSAAGYLTRTAHPHDRRQSLIGLTPAGTRLVKRTFDTFAADIDQAVAEAQPVHRRELSALLDRITASLHARATELRAAQRGDLQHGDPQHGDPQHGDPQHGDTGAGT